MASLKQEVAAHNLTPGDDRSIGECFKKGNGLCYILNMLNYYIFTSNSD